MTPSRRKLALDPCASYSILLSSKKQKAGPDYARAGLLCISLHQLICLSACTLHFRLPTRGAFWHHVLHSTLVLAVMFVSLRATQIALIAFRQASACCACIITHRKVFVLVIHNRIPGDLLVAIIPQLTFPQQVDGRQREVQSLEVLLNFINYFLFNCRRYFLFFFNIIIMIPKLQIIKCHSGKIHGVVVSRSKMPMHMRIRR